MIVDYERANFTVAQAVFPDPLPPAQVITIVSPSDSPPKQADSSSSSSSDLGTGAIVGIAVGAVAVIVVAIVAFFLVRKRRGAKQQQHQHYELGGKNISEADSRQDLTSLNRLPLKAPAPQELSGTPLTELASPANAHVAGHGYPQDHKVAISVTDEPQELHGDSIIPVTPRWSEVPNPYHRDVDMESNSSQVVSTMLSEDSYATGESGLNQAAVSPLTPRAPHFRS